MSIVIATDFSPCSRTAVSLAVALARRQKATLVMVHAVEPRATDVPMVPIGVIAWEDAAANFSRAFHVGVVLGHRRRDVAGDQRYSDRRSRAGGLRARAANVR
jgi:hypothetical protein